MSAVSRPAAHELLVRLAGRLPDDVLWRLRDWLASAKPAPVAALLPRMLLRHRIGITDGERELLSATTGPGRLADAVLPQLAAEESRFAFAAGPELPDLAALGALAVVRGHHGAAELRQAVRGPHGTQRVLLVLGAERPWELTATLQRLLRACGERTPCVEVLPEPAAPGWPTAYHGAAIAASRLLWAAPARRSTGPAAEPVLAAPSPGAD